MYEAIIHTSVSSKSNTTGHVSSSLVAWKKALVSEDAVIHTCQSDIDTSEIEGEI